MTSTWTIREWDNIPYSELGEDVVAELEEASGRLGVRVFDFFRHSLRTRSYVGVVAVGGNVVEILPKTLTDDSQSVGYLLALLRYTGDIATTRADATGLAEHGGSFLEAWIHHFATSLNHLLRRNYKQKYVEIEERTPFVRGRLLTERDLDGSSNIYAKYPCRYEIFTPDHLLNRTLKFCNRLLVKQSRSPANRSILRENDAILTDVSDVPVFARDLDRIHLDRLDREYEPMLVLCRLLLENSALDLRAGRITQLALVFDMNILFEKFIAAFLERNAGRISIGNSRITNVRRQKYLGDLFGKFGMKVDIAIRTDDGAYLLDTKYKVLNDKETRGNLSQSDFYQMFGYLRAGDEKYENVILLYPRNEVSPEDAVFENGEGARLFVRTVDVVKCHDGYGNISTDVMLEELERVFGGIEVPEGVTV